MTILDRFRLDGKAALVTGGSRGLGFGIARGLREAGARVMLAARTERELERAASELDPEGKGLALACPTDVTKLAEVERAVDRTVDEFGSLDLVVNSAGVNIRKPAVEYTEDDWHRVVDTNLKAAFFLSTRAAKVMLEATEPDRDAQDSQDGERQPSSPSCPSLLKRSRGKIVHVASLATAVGLPTNIPPYTASKGGLGLLVKALAGEWAPHGICVNAIGPGYFATEMTADLLNDPARRDGLLGRIPVGRFGEPSDLAGAAVFLCSSASDYVTGQVLYVDGGYLTR